MSSANKVWMVPPYGRGEPKQVEATPEVLVPLMLAGWAQCEPPKCGEEVTKNVHD